MPTAAWAGRETETLAMWANERNENGRRHQALLRDAGLEPLLRDAGLEPLLHPRSFTVAQRSASTRSARRSGTFGTEKLLLATKSRQEVDPNGAEGTPRALMKCFFSPQPKCN